MDDRLADLAGRNVKGAFRAWLGSWLGAEVVDEAGFLMVSTGLSSSLANAVLHCTLPKDAARERVAFVKDWVGRTGLPLAWGLNSVAELEQMTPLLADAGFERRLRMPAMVLTRDSFVPAKPCDGVINELTTATEVEEWAAACGTIFAFREDLWPFLACPYLKNPNLVGFSLLTDRVVATSTVFVQGDTAGLYCVGTLAEERGKGYGSAITQVCIERAFAMGAEYVILQSSSSGLPVYEKLGFRTVGTHKRWSLPVTL